MRLSIYISYTSVPHPQYSHSKFNKRQSVNSLYIYHYINKFLVYHNVTYIRIIRLILIAASKQYNSSRIQIVLSKGRKRNNHEIICIHITNERREHITSQNKV